MKVSEVEAASERVESTVESRVEFAESAGAFGVGIEAESDDAGSRESAAVEVSDTKAGSVVVEPSDSVSERLR
jgi:hypothetical protein